MRSAVIAFACFVLCAGTARANSITLSYSAGDGCFGSATGSGTLIYANNGCTGTTLAAVTDVQVVASSFMFQGYFDTMGSSDIPARQVLLQVSDLITVTGGSGSGTLVLPWSFDGTLTGGTPDPVLYPSYYANLFMLGPNNAANFVACDGLVAGVCGPTGTVTVTSQVVNFTIPFTYGTPMQLNWYVQAVISSGCTFFNSCNSLANTGSGTIDFTATLLPLQIFDAAGAQNFSALVTGEDGSVYSVAAPSQVPEPATLMLVSLGALLTAREVRSRRRMH